MLGYGQNKIPVLGEFKPKIKCGRQDKNGTIVVANIECRNNFKASIQFISNASPKFFKNRPIPFSLMSQFKKEIERLIQTNIIQPRIVIHWVPNSQCWIYS